MKRALLFAICVLLIGATVGQAKEEPRTNPNHYTVPAPLGRAYSEGFEAGVPPAGWTLISTPGHTQALQTTWFQGVSLPYEGMGYATCLYDPALVPQDEWLHFNGSITAVDHHLNFAAYASYYWMVSPYMNYDLVVTVNGTPVWSMQADTSWNTSFQYYIFDVDLSAYIGQTVDIGFGYVGTDGAELAVDAVGINGGFTPPPPPAGDTCETAVALPCGAFNVTGTTVGSANNYDPLSGGCTGYSATGPDVVYYTDLAVGGVFSVTMSTGGVWDDSIYLVTDCANVAGSCVAGDDQYPDMSTFTYTATTAGRYYLIVDGYGGASGSYTITGTNPCGPPVATEPTTWGTLKGLYR